MDTQSTGTLQSPSTYSEGSKTGSSKSDGAVPDNEKELDLTKDNAASPIDLECHIQSERITKILDEAIYKTKLAIALPHLVQEYRTIHSILSPQHMDDLIFIFEQYDNPLFSASLLNMAAMEDIKSGDMSLKNRLNPELGHLIYIMNSYPVLRTKAEQLVNEMKGPYLKKTEGKQLSPPLEYLLALEQFRELMVTQMNMTAADELGTKIRTRKLETSNENLIKKIDEYTTSIQTENEQFNKTMSVKAEFIAKLEMELTFLNHTAALKLKSQVLDSDRQMVLASRAHVVKNEMLKEEEVETREGYQQLLKSHLLDEKNQRARRFKVETQLLSWLQKYDTEMTDKQEELDEYIEKYDEEEKKCEELEEKLAEQDKEYIPLMAERDEEYHREMTEKMEKFMLEHAARVIQTAWREVLANRAEKRKLKKLLVKVRAAQELAERRAEAEKRRQAAAERAAKKKDKKKK